MGLYKSGGGRSNPAASEAGYPLASLLPAGIVDLFEAAPHQVVQAVAEGGFGRLRPAAQAKVNIHHTAVFYHHALTTRPSYYNNNNIAILNQLHLFSKNSEVVKKEAMGKFCLNFLPLTPKEPFHKPSPTIRIHPYKTCLSPAYGRKDPD